MSENDGHYKQNLERQYLKAQKCLRQILLQQGTLKATTKEEFARLQLELTGVPRKVATNAQVGQEKKSSPAADTQTLPDSSSTKPQPCDSKMSSIVSISDEKRESEDMV